MTAFINGGLRNQIGPSNNDNNSISLSKRSGEMVEPQQALRLPSPALGRGEPKLRREWGFVVCNSSRVS